VELHGLREMCAMYELSSKEGDCSLSSMNDSMVCSVDERSK
jgi:hypothetical protein